MDSGTIVEITKIVIWPIIILIFLLFFTIFFRVQLKELIQRLIIKFKKGDTELEVNQRDLPTKPDVEKVTSGETAAGITSPEDNARALASEFKSPDELMQEMTKEILDRNFEKGETLFKQLQETERDSVEKLKNEGLYHFFRYQRGDTSALSKLNELTKDSNISHFAHFWLGISYEEGNEFDKAFEEFSLAAKEAKSQEKSASYIVNSARALYKNNKKQEGFQIIMTEIAKSSNDEVFAVLYQGLAELYSLDENFEFKGLAIEKAITYKPNDTQLLFDLAYAYSQVNQDDLSLLHYKTLLIFFPEHDFALNNAGVAYSLLHMPIKSVDCYKQSFELGNTLAASNLATEYLGAGFAKEATEVIEKTKGQKDAHRNTGSTFSRILDDKENENKKEKELLEVARKKQRFLRAFADAYFVQREKGINLSGSWQFPNGILVSVTQQQQNIEVKWVEKNEQTKKISGIIVNRAAQIEPVSNHDKLYVTQDCKTIHIMLKTISGYEFKDIEKTQENSSSTSE